jgi:hypothetical protein
VITRQFDDALTTYGTLINQFPWNESEFTFMETFQNYLKLALRVGHDATRQLTILHAIRDRSDIPSSLAEPLSDWIEGLNIVQTGPVEAELETYILMTYGGLEEIDPEILDPLNELNLLIEDAQ